MNNIKKLFTSKKTINIPFQLFFILNAIMIGILNASYFQYVYREDIDRQSNLFATIIILIMSFWTYILSIITKPYQNNLDSILNTTRPEGNIIDLKDNQFNLNCDFCKMRKHDRSSHCKICDRCILRRDHHCFFIGKCIGYSNHRYFINYVVWLLILDILTMSNYIRYFNLSVEEKKEFFSYNWINSIVFYFYFCLGIFCFISLISLFLVQILFIANDIPFLEKMRKHYIEFNLFCKKSYDSRYQANLYSKGFLFNYYRIIGPSILHLFFPLPIERKYNVEEINPTFNKLPIPNSFNIYTLLVKENNIDRLKEYEDSIQATEPEKFLKLSCDYYKNKIIK